MIWRFNGLGLLLVGMLLAGCGHSAQTESAPAGATAAHSNDGWWCGEHGVPEEECGQCNSKLAGEFQKKGDWCQEHQRPDSQCFVCHPELEAKFAARYEAKFGKPPPKAGHGHDHGEKHDHDHKDDKPKS